MGKKHGRAKAKTFKMMDAKSKAQTMELSFCSFRGHRTLSRFHDHGRDERESSLKDVCKKEI